MRIVIKIISFIIIIYFTIYPGINMLYYKNYYEDKTNTTSINYIFQKGIIKNVSIIKNEKTGISYDKSFHRITVQYLIVNQNIDTLYENFEAYTYALKNIKLKNINDTIEYYKSLIDDKNITANEYNQKLNSDNSLPAFFPIVLIIIGLILIIIVHRIIKI